MALSQLTSDGARQLLGASRIVQSNERPDSSVFSIENDVVVESPSTSSSEISSGVTSKGSTVALNSSALPMFPAASIARCSTVCLPQPGTKSGNDCSKVAFERPPLPRLPYVSALTLKPEGPNFIGVPNGCSGKPK